MQRMIALLQRALGHGRASRVPAGVVGQPWREVRVQVTFARSCGAWNLRLLRDVIITSDPNDLRRLDPAAQIISI